VIGTKQLCCNLNQSIALQIWCQLKYWQTRIKYLSTLEPLVWSAAFFNFGP
jgi:hypothetical protein